MSRHYRPMTRATRDARAEANPAPVNIYRPVREPATIRAIVDGQHFEAEGTPARRADQFVWVLNGEHIGVGGLEFAWREIQKRRAPLLGERNLM